MYQVSVELDTAGEASIEVPSRLTPPLFLLGSGLNACDSYWSVVSGDKAGLSMTTAEEKHHIGRSWFNTWGC